jgi:hypothetical protein
MPRRHIPAVIAGDLVQASIPSQSRQPCLMPFKVDEVMDSTFQPGDIDAKLLTRGRRTGARHTGWRCARRRCDGEPCTRGDGFAQPAEAEQHKKHWDKDGFFSHGDTGEVVF